MPDDRPTALTLDHHVAHQLRSALNALSLSLELLETGNSEARARMVSMARRKAQVLSDLIDEFSGTVRPPQDGPGGAGTGAAVAAAHPRPGTRVLVVEDEYLLAQTVSDHLKRAACEVVGPVGTVEDTLGLLPGHVLDCAVVDANLDGEFSSPIVEALAARGVPTVVLSGYDQAAIPAAFQGLPFLQKPVHAAELLGVVAGLSAAAAHRGA